MIRSAAMGFTTWIPSPVENHSVSFWKMYSHQRGWSAHTHTQHCKKNSAQATAELHSAQAAVSLPLAERNTSQLGTTGPPRQGDHMGKIGENSQIGHDGPAKAPRGDIGPALQRFAAQWYQWPHGWKRFARYAQPWKKSSIGGVSQGATPALEPSPPTVGSFFEVPVLGSWFIYRRHFLRSDREIRFPSPNAVIDSSISDHRTYHAYVLHT